MCLPSKYLRGTLPFVVAALWGAAAATHARAAAVGGLRGLASLPSSSQEPLPKVVRYAERLIQQYDADGDGRLQADEWGRLRGEPARLDRNQDGAADVEEVAAYVTAYGRTRQLAPSRPATNSEPEPVAAPHGEAAAAPPAKRFHVPERFLPQGLPEWFAGRDANGDGQLSLAEFAPSAEAQQVAQFERLDVNQDGLLTAREATGAGAASAPAAVD
jgi:hypothetical protein